MFKVVVPDNASAIVADADAVNPRFTAGWLDYAQHCGFATDAARVRSPKDKPRVERTVQYVRGNFFAGEDFAGLPGAQPARRSGARALPGRGSTARSRPARPRCSRSARLPSLLPVAGPMTCRCSRP